MSSLFKSLRRGDEDEEIDLEFDTAEPECYELPPDRENNQLLAVWGSPGSGKSITATRIARYIASRKKNVILVFADTCAPPLPYVCPAADLEAAFSIGNILGCAEVTDNLIKQNAVLHKKNEYLTMFGYTKGENSFSHPPYGESQVREFLAGLRKMSDYIIVDCTSAITSDMLSAMALIEADVALRLVSCDLKAISYLASQMPILLDNKFNMNKQLKAVSNIGAFQADDTIEQIVGGVHFKIPHSAEVEQQFLSGNFLASLTQKDSAEYRKVIAKISNEVFSL